MIFYRKHFGFAGCCGLLALGLSAMATPSQAQSTQAQSTQATAPADDKLAVYFDTGSAAIVGDQTAVLDKAARLYREGSPIVMIVAGGTDTVGPAALNLQLSVERADAVVKGLVARGIPVDRLQVAGRGETDLPVKTQDDVAERENRDVQITWR